MNVAYTGTTNLRLTQLFFTKDAELCSTHGINDALLKRLRFYTPWLRRQSSDVSTNGTQRRPQDYRTRLYYQVKRCG